jgi:hypothetical protein
MTHLRQRMLEELQRPNYSPATIRFYLPCVAEFPLHFHRSPDQLGAEDIRQFQLFLIKQKRGDSIGIVLGEPSRYRRAHKNQAISAQPSERAREGTRRALHFPKMKRHRWRKRDDCNRRALIFSRTRRDESSQTRSSPPIHFDGLSATRGSVMDTRFHCATSARRRYTAKWRCQCGCRMLADSVLAPPNICETGEMVLAF